MFYDVAAGTGNGEFNQPPFDAVTPTGINDSQLISEDASYFHPVSGPPGSVALVSGKILPPGVFDDRSAGINSAGIVAGNSDGSAVLWIPNP